MTDPRQALDRLRHAAQAGELGVVCQRFGVVLLVAFGSTVHGSAEPRDLDLAMSYETGSPDLLGFLDEVSTLAGTSQIDLMDLRRAGPVAREKALVGGEPLVEQTPGSFSRTQLAAIMERLDTDWLRRMELDLLAHGR
jgi:predicted nucleotidyltransferase